MKKTKPEELCGKMKFCDGFTQCELFKEWPIKHLPAEPKSWPVERRQLLDIHDFKDIHILKDFFDKIIEKYVLPKKEESKSFALFSQILVALLKEIHDKKDPPATGNDAYDKCGHDVKCKLEAVGAHLPLQVSLSLRFKGWFLFTVDILCNVEWCFRQLWCSSIIFYNITSIGYNRHTDIYPLLNIKTYLYMCRTMTVTASLPRSVSEAPTGVEWTATTSPTTYTPAARLGLIVLPVAILITTVTPS